MCTQLHLKNKTHKGIHSSAHNKFCKLKSSSIIHKFVEIAILNLYWKENMGGIREKHFYIPYHSETHVRLII